MLAMTVMGGAVLAAVLAGQRRTLGLEAVQRKTDLHTWESEGGSPVQAAIVPDRALTAFEAGDRPASRGY